MTVASPQHAYVSCVCMTRTEFAYTGMRTQTDLYRRHPEFSKIQRWRLCKPSWTSTHLSYRLDMLRTGFVSVEKRLCLISIFKQLSDYYISIYMFSQSQFFYLIFLIPDGRCTTSCHSLRVMMQYHESQAF
jgi:hypothetical protein